MSSLYLFTSGNCLEVSNHTIFVLVFGFVILSCDMVRDACVCNSLLGFLKWVADWCSSVVKVSFGDMVCQNYNGIFFYGLAGFLCFD